MVNPTFSNTPSNDENNPTRYVIFDSSQLTQDRTVIWPDLNIKAVGEASAQTISNKVYKGAVFCDTDVNDGEGRKIQFDLSNIEDNQSYTYSFPDNDPTAPLNNGSDPNMLVSEKKTQTLVNKTLELMKIKFLKQAQSQTVVNGLRPWINLGNRPDQVFFIAEKTCRVSLTLPSREARNP